MENCHSTGHNHTKKILDRNILFCLETQKETIKTINCLIITRLFMYYGHDHFKGVQTYVAKEN